MSNEQSPPRPPAASMKPTLADGRRPRRFNVRPFGTLDRRWFLFFGVFLAVLAAVMAYTKLSPVTYTAGAKLYATYTNAMASTSNYGDMNNASSYIGNEILSYPDLAHTETVLDPVLQTLGMERTPSALRLLADAIEVTNPKNTHIVDVQVTDGDPERAAAIANAVGESLCRYVSQNPADAGTEAEETPIHLGMVQHADVPTSPSSPNTKFNLVAGLVIGLALGGLAVYAHGLFSRKVQAVEEMQAFLEAPVLGTIPDASELKAGVPIIMSEPNSALAERYRNLRTNMSFMKPVPDTQTRLIVVSSVDVAEGKGTTSVNLASALAEHGHRVLLIDTDLRHPSLEDRLNIAPHYGLSHVLRGQAKITDAVQRYRKGNMFILSAGSRPGNVTVLLNSPRMQEVLDWAYEHFDYVVLDTAPLIVANDAAEFVRHGARLVLVARQGATSKQDLRAVRRNLNNLHVSVDGIIATCTKESYKHRNKNYFYYMKNRPEQAELVRNVRGAAVREFDDRTFSLS